ncbi:FMN-dependent NADH-azoreductase [Erythrobacter sp. SG61-1L]|uniref:FMN-dependent NADH-azoreductase n=1 Tax=Erythrobacter sp. SG61-1L TaxID=1603897 RepID=UPI0006C9193E|nr:FMN-dependent NADH-azoreductase [Erythrobacter sp. SG61-1L]KPL67922.1 FMN-dependent NADH-azoreductase [Erythrobacter sp. SG61-1L]
MKILHIDSATTGPNSVSRELTKAIVDHFTAKNPGAEVSVLDLESNPLPHLTNVTTGAIRMPAEAHTPEMAAAFPAERAVLDQFLASDVVVIGAPMYNFTIPSSLKAWLDRLGVPGVTFSYSEAGPQGLAGGRRVIVASSRGGEYGFDGPMEHQETYLRDMFGFIGVDNVEFIRADKIGYGPEVRAASIAAAKEEIAKL